MYGIHFIRHYKKRKKIQQQQKHQYLLSDKIFIMPVIYLGPIKRIPLGHRGWGGGEQHVSTSQLLAVQKLRSMHGIVDPFLAH